LTLAVLPKPTEKQRASYGTMWEVGASYVLGKPVVIVTDDPVITQHPLFGGAVAMWVVDNLDEALDKIISLLQDY
jgi:nucleoside 2-deoxyribosyltransferase